MDRIQQVAWLALKRSIFGATICTLSLFLSAKLQDANELISALIISVTSIILVMILLLEVRSSIKKISKDGNKDAR